MEIKIIDFKIMGDNRGSLISLEQNRNIPFEIQRVYYIFDTKKDVRRGFHAHKNLKQVLVAVHGSCKVLLDDGISREVVTLDSPSFGLYIDSFVWREMYDFSEDCVLLVLASEYYDENDYIRKYEEFLTLVKNNIGLSFVEFDSNFRAKSWEWLQDDELRRLTQSPKISLEQQINWFNNLKKRKDYLIRGISYHGNPIGAVGIKNIVKGERGEYWGYIGEKAYWSKGLGKFLVNEAILWAKEMKLKELYLKVDKENVRAFKLYQKFGFRVTKEVNGTLYMSLRIADKV